VTAASDNRPPNINDLQFIVPSFKALRAPLRLSNALIRNPVAAFRHFHDLRHN
jgi:hypothetical protein